MQARLKLTRAFAGALLLAVSPPMLAQSPVGFQFQVNTYTSYHQVAPWVAVAPTGDFVVVWTSDGSNNGDTSTFSVQGQRYASNGDSLGGEFLVNTYTTNYQFHSSVAMDAEGDFVVVWESLGSDNGDTSSYSVQGQRYASNGAPVGGQFLVNTYTMNSQYRPAVAVSSAGDFVVVWESDGVANWLKRLWAGSGLKRGVASVEPAEAVVPG